MYFDGTCYLFDLLKFNPFKFGLDEVFSDDQTVKIFHDFCED